MENFPTETLIGDHKNAFLFYFRLNRNDSLNLERDSIYLKWKKKNKICYNFSVFVRSIRSTANWKLKMVYWADSGSNDEFENSNTDWRRKDDTT